MRKNKSHSKILAGLVFLAAVSGSSLTALTLSACGGTEPLAGDTSQILISAPKGGDSYKVGQTLYIKWKLQGKGITDIPSVEVAMSPDNGKRWELLLNKSIIPSDVEWGNFPWVIPDSINISGIGKVNLVNNSECRIRIRMYGSADPATTTITTNFTIKP